MPSIKRKCIERVEDKICRVDDVMYYLTPNRVPVGAYDGAGRWYPTPEEDGEDLVGRIRAPSYHWPHSYRDAAKKRRHTRVLVRRGLANLPVPRDIQFAIMLVFPERRPATQPASATLTWEDSP